MNNLPNDWPLVDPFDYGIRPGEHLMFASSVGRKSVKHTARIALSSLKESGSGALPLIDLDVWSKPA